MRTSRVSRALQALHAAAQLVDLALQLAPFVVKALQCAHEQPNGLGADFGEGEHGAGEVQQVSLSDLATTTAAIRSVTAWLEGLNEQLKVAGSGSESRGRFDRVHAPDGKPSVHWGGGAP